MIAMLELSVRLFLNRETERKEGMPAPRYAGDEGLL